MRVLLVLCAANTAGRNATDTAEGNSTSTFAARVRRLYRETTFVDDGSMVTSGGVLGRDHACELTGKKFVYCWGDNAMGQLGYEDMVPRERKDCAAVDVGCEALGARTQDGGCVIGLAAGAYHTCVLLNEGSVKCWGQNNAGQLGYGDSRSRGNDSGEMGSDLPTVRIDGRVKSLECGERHSCVKFRSNKVQCWGRCPQTQAASLAATEMPSEGCELFHKMPTAVVSLASVAVLLLGA